MEVLGQLYGRLVALRLPVTVIDIGPTGFAIEAPVPFPDRTPHAFRLTSEPDVEAVLTAISVRSARLDRPLEPPVYVTGFEFVLADQAARDAVDRLMDSISAAHAT